MDDSELLHQYVTEGSHEAFAELVRRHIDLIYGAASRQVRDPASAEEITQSVFIVLARRASTIRGGAALPGWLLAATRYAVLNAQTSASRRRFHEQQAAAMARTSYDPPESPEPISPLLDEALTRLSEKDRSAIALRFLQGKSMREVGMTMGLSEAAAIKRVTRAVERMRGFFARRGVTLESAGMTQLVPYRAPAALAQQIAAGALATSAGTATAAGSVTLALAVIRTLAWTQIRYTAAAAASLLIVGAAAAVVLKSEPRPVASQAPAHPATNLVLHATDIWMPYVPNNSPGTQITQVENDSLRAGTNRNPGFFVGIDPQVKRTDQPAAVIRSLPTFTKGGAYFEASIPVLPYLGKRVRFSACLKSQNIATAGYIGLQIYRGDDNLYAHDEMDGHELVGTHDWQRFDIVSDVPPDATKIMLRPRLIGKGTLWIDDCEICVVDPSVPTHDDHGWRSSGTAPAKYTTDLDKVVLHEGRPTIRLTGAANAKGEWIAYAHTDHDAEAFLGKRVRLTVMMKSSDVVTSAGPFIRAVGPDDSALRLDEQSRRRPITGSFDWQAYSTFLNVPEQSQGVCIGVLLAGPGTVWFDDVRLEVVPN